MLRRSSRIASKYGPVYSNLPSISSIRRQKKTNDIWSLAKEMKAALRYEDKKNPLAFTVEEGNIRFHDAWATKRYINDPLSGISYDRVRVLIVCEGHTGECSDPDIWSNVSEQTLILHFTPFTKTDRKRPLQREWIVNAAGHEECGATIRYFIQSIDRIFIETQHTCIFCNKPVEFMEWCMCQLESSLTLTSSFTTINRSCIHCHINESDCCMTPCTEEFHDFE